MSDLKYGFATAVGILVVLGATFGLAALLDAETDPHTGIVVGKYIIPEHCGKTCKGPYNAVVIQTDSDSDPEEHYVDGSSYRRVTFGARMTYHDGRLYSALSPIGLP